MIRHDLMPSRTLRVLLLALILMTLALLAAPRGAEARLVVEITKSPVKVVSSPRATMIAAAPHGARVVAVARPAAPRVTVARRDGPRTIVRCGTPAGQRAWAPGRWERTGPRSSRWIPGHWKFVARR